MAGLGDRVLLAEALSDVGLYAECVLGRPLRSYQLPVARAICASVVGGLGLKLTVMLPRQSGKNWISATVEAYLLTLWSRAGGQIVKACPTFKPQSINSMLRLRDWLEGTVWTRRGWRPRLGYMVELGHARALFFSADPASAVVGATADLLLEIDEAQDVPEARYGKDFAPMGASTNATTVFYGTAWTADTLLARMKRVGLEEQARDGVRRHYQLNWRDVARENVAYGAYVEGEIARLGQDHVLVRTQYEQEELEAGGGLFSAAQQLLLRGEQERLLAPRAGRLYVAGLDVASADEQAAEAVIMGERQRHDSTVLLIAELVAGPALTGWRGQVVAAYVNTGRTVSEQYGGLLELLRRWHVATAFVDATGMGQPLASWLVEHLTDGVVVPWVYTSGRKSQMMYDLLALINGGRMAWWRTPVGVDGSLDLEVADAESREFWREVGLARYQLVGRQTMRWGVPPEEGWDDFVNALALCGLAVAHAGPPAADLALVPKPLYGGERPY